MIAPARLAAYQTLIAVSTLRRDLPSALADARARLNDPRDRSLTTEIATGTLRWRGQLDHLIEHFTHRSLSRLDQEIVEILRLSLYQILFLDRIPTSAAVNAAVELSRTLGKASAAGFVNGVLRAVSRNRHALPLPPRPAAGRIDDAETADKSALDYLSATLSHPRWLAARWLTRYGLAGAEAWERFNNAAPPLTLHVNTLKTSVGELVEALARYNVGVEPARFAPDALVVSAGNPLATPLAESGVFIIQDEASQLVARLTGVRSGEHVFDACAAPGGKTLVMCSMMGDRGLLVANDARPKRLALLRRTIAMSGARSIRIVQSDVSRSSPFRNRFDCVLIDAPCSGLGTLRRDPEIRWRRVEPDLRRFAETQASLLAEAANLVRPGGRLLYATCSSEPEENDDVVAAFLDRQRMFALVHPRSLDPELPEGLAAVLDERGCLRTSPSDHGLEAFFGAVLCRRA